jgi:hypothetical protein
MVYRTGKRTLNATMCHNMTVRGERGEVCRSPYRITYLSAPRRSKARVRHCKVGVAAYCTHHRVLNAGLAGVELHAVAVDYWV